MTNLISVDDTLSVFNFETNNRIKSFEINENDPLLIIKAFK